MLKKIAAMVLTLFFLMVYTIPLAECYDAGNPQIIWQAQKLGKSTDFNLGPNGLFYLFSGNKLVAVDAGGQKLWEATVPGGAKAGRLIFDQHGSVFYPGSAFIQEIKLNGGSGWSFAVYQGNNKDDSQLTFGPGNLLYLPLASGLYAVDTAGKYKWMMHWESDDAISTQADKGRKTLACAGTTQAVYVATGIGGKENRLVAVGGDGEILWGYWLGDIKAVNLATGSDGRLFVNTGPIKNADGTLWKVCAFDSKSDGSPLWSNSVKCNNMTEPTVSEHGLLYFRADDKLVALNQADGTEAWSNLIYKVVTAPAVDEGSKRVYLGTQDNRLLAVNQQGRLDWELTLDGKVSCRPLFGPGGIIYVTTEKGSLYKIQD
ncbi:outer membrane biogenesis protein BamB [Pelotomaculum sp. FP]|uniref:outer membrane protein assembly factor BamB family protein n=1 Tax=Pelotomaculum sp. FP TaxID=261474 RepID=UPI001064DD22|nr:PQQ-binding-like beta-propeller repeat protein [Pelotomaculum sp. FP]TEB16709.1 outer membrane biogenesis protein BamB [Pelotomaculum sp. FP]